VYIAAGWAFKIKRLRNTVGQKVFLMMLMFSDKLRDVLPVAAKRLTFCDPVGELHGAAILRRAKQFSNAPNVIG
jgi:hypothetical protein